VFLLLHDGHGALALGLCSVHLAAGTELVLIVIVAGGGRKLHEVGLVGLLDLGTHAADVGVVRTNAARQTVVGVYQVDDGHLLLLKVKLAFRVRSERFWLVGGSLTVEHFGVDPDQHKFRCVFRRGRSVSASGRHNVLVVALTYCAVVIVRRNAELAFLVSSELVFGDGGCVCGRALFGERIESLGFSCDGLAERAVSRVLLDSDVHLGHQQFVLLQNGVFVGLALALEVDDVPLDVVRVLLALVHVEGLLQLNQLLDHVVDVLLGLVDVALDGIGVLLLTLSQTADPLHPHLVDQRVHLRDGVQHCGQVAYAHFAVLLHVERLAVVLLDVLPEVAQFLLHFDQQVPGLAHFGLSELLGHFDAVFALVNRLVLVLSTHLLDLEVLQTHFDFRLVVLHLHEVFLHLDEAVVLGQQVAVGLLVLVVFEFELGGVVEAVLLRTRVPIGRLAESEHFAFGAAHAVQVLLGLPGLKFSFKQGKLSHLGVCQLFLLGFELLEAVCNLSFAVVLAFEFIFDEFRPGGQTLVQAFLLVLHVVEVKEIGALADGLLGTLVLPEPVVVLPLLAGAVEFLELHDFLLPLPLLGELRSLLRDGVDQRFALDLRILVVLSFGGVGLPLVQSLLKCVVLCLDVTDVLCYDRGLLEELLFVDHFFDPFHSFFTRFNDRYLFFGLVFVVFFICCCGVFLFQSSLKGYVSMFFWVFSHI